MTRVLLLTVVAAFCLAGSAAAQTARATGIVRDGDGKAVRGATIRATNPEAHPPEIVSTSDNNGRWAMLGMRIGTYTFFVEAPGFLPLQASAAVRTAATSPLEFTLARDPGPIPGALPSNIQAQLRAAASLHEQGRLDRAISAYQEIRVRSPKLTTVNLVVADLFREKAAQEADPAARRVLLDRAIALYTELLSSDAENEHAARELERTRAEAAALLE